MLSKSEFFLSGDKLLPCPQHDFLGLRKMLSINSEQNVKGFFRKLTSQNPTSIEKIKKVLKEKMRPGDPDHRQGGAMVMMDKEAYQESIETVKPTTYKTIPANPTT